MKPLAQEDLEKIKRWVRKQNKFHCPHCGEKCIITEKENERNGN